MGDIIVVTVYMDEDLVKQLDEAMRQLRLRISRSAFINLLVYKFLVDNGFMPESILSHEELIRQLYVQLQREKNKRRLPKLH